MSKDSATVIKDGQLAVATVPQTGTLVGAASEIDATALVETADGLQLCVKTCEVGGGGGGGTVDQTYDPTSTNAQSGTAVAEAVAPALKNTATGNNALTILGTSTRSQDSINIGAYSSAVGISTVAIGRTAQTTSDHCVAIGNQAYTSGYRSIALGHTSKTNGVDAIQLGMGTNSNAKTLQVYEYQLLDGNTGKIPAERIGTGYDATKTQVLKNVNGTLTWVDE